MLRCWFVSLYPALSCKNDTSFFFSPVFHHRCVIALLQAYVSCVAGAASSFRHRLFGLECFAHYGDLLLKSVL